MATGDVVNPSRPRYEANERFDTVDADAASLSPLEQIDALMRAALTTPRAAGVTVPTGLILTGFSLTPNPTGPADGKVRINSELGVAVDADGRLIIKPAGTTVDITVGVGSQQLYVYFTEDPGDTAKRRFLTVSSPYTEYSQAMDTTYQSTFGTHTRAGTNANIVASDTVAGITRALLCIAIASNAAGVITIAGYNATTAPNGSDIVNRMSAVTAPTTAPTVNTRNGSPKTLHDLLVAALYSVGQAMWKGSDFLTPAAGNNFGAYSLPAGGVDKAFRQALGFVTVGDGTTVFGDVNQSSYANDKLLLDAAIAALPATGGTILLKRGVALTNFATLNVALPANKTVIIQGDHAKYPSSTPQLSFAASGEGLDCTATTTLILRNLHIRATHSAVVLATGCSLIVENCYCEKPSGAFGAPFFNGSGQAINNSVIRDCEYDATLTANGPGSGSFLDAGLARDLLVKNVKCRFNGTAGVNTAIRLQDVRNNVVLEDVDIRVTADSSAGGGGINAVELGSSDNTTEIRGRVLRNLTVRGKLTNAGLQAQWRALSFAGVGYLTIEDFTADYCNIGLYASIYSGPGYVTVNRAKIRGTATNVSIGSVVPYFTFRDCLFDGGTHTLGNGTNTVNNLQIVGCRFLSSAPVISGVNVLNVEVLDSYISGDGASTQYGIDVAGSSTVEGVYVRSTKFRYIQNAALPNVYTLRIVAQLLREVVYSGNEVEQFQNVVYSGADATSSPRIVEIDADIASTNVVVSNNVIQRVMNAASGNARRGVYLLDVNSEDRATVSTASGLNIHIHGNTLGQDNDVVMLLRTRNVYPRQVTIDDNTLYSAWNTGATDTKASDWVSIVLPAAGILPLDNLHFNDNVVRIDNNDLANISEDLIFVSSAGNTLENFCFSDNHILQTDSGSTWDFVNAWGINCDMNVTNLMVLGNQAGRSGTTSGAAHFETRFTGAVTRTNHTGGVLPGVGVAWINNNLIHGG